MEGFEKYYIPLAPKGGVPQNYDLTLRRTKAQEAANAEKPPVGPIPGITPQPQLLPDQKP